MSDATYYFWRGMIFLVATIISAIVFIVLLVRYRKLGKKIARLDKEEAEERARHERR